MMAGKATRLEKAQRHKEEGNTYFKYEKYDEAIVAYSKAIEICPKNKKEEIAIFYQNRAAAYEKLKNDDAVIIDCTKAIELNPKYTKAIYRRLHALVNIGHLESALEDVSAIIIYEKFPNPEIRHLRDDLLKQLGQQQAQENIAKKKFIMPSKYVIWDHMRSFTNDPIFSMLQLPLPENIPEAFKKPLQALKEENYDEIIPLCTEAIDSSEFNTLSCKMEILLLRATFYLHLGEYDLIVRDVATIMKSDESSKDVKVNALIKRAHANVETGQLERAYADLGLAIKINPSCCDIYFYKGLINLTFENADEAKSNFDKALHYNPNFKIPLIYKFCADVHFTNVHKNMKLQMDMENCEKILEEFPDYAECHVLYAQILIKFQQGEKAEKYFDKVIEKSPQVYVHKALMQLELNGSRGITNAVKYINRALELDEKCKLAYHALARIEVGRGNLNKGIKLYDKAIELCHTFMQYTGLCSSRAFAKIRLSVRNKLGQDPYLIDNNLGWSMLGMALQQSL